MFPVVTISGRLESSRQIDQKCISRESARRCARAGLSAARARETAARAQESAAGEAGCRAGAPVPAAAASESRAHAAGCDARANGAAAPVAGASAPAPARALLRGFSASPRGRIAIWQSPLGSFRGVRGGMLSRVPREHGRADGTRGITRCSHAHDAITR